MSTKITAVRLTDLDKKRIDFIKKNVKDCHTNTQAMQLALQKVCERIEQLRTTS